MKKNYIYLLLILPFLGFSQGKSLWIKADETSIKQETLLDRNSTPTEYKLYNLDLVAMKQILLNAPDRDLNESSEIVLQFPSAKGKMETFEIYNASILEKEFASNYPDIQSYVAVSKENTGTIIRFSTTIFGFHATVHTIGKTYYIDPMTKDLQTYVMYAKENLLANSFEERIGCLVDEFSNSEKRGSSTDFASKNANDGTLRTFRLALACTQEYANYHINAAGQAAASDAVKRATVLAAMNVTMTRVNAVFERDMSLTMTLVDNTSIIFLAENDGYTNNSSTALISENQAIINANIGTANYDIGHVFSTGGGGLAARGGICYSNAKASAVTGSSNPVGDPFDIDFVAHEMGHQYGANHTFNGGSGSCSGGNRSATTAVEPGSGTTIMAYAGICAPQNVQANSDDHFHAISIDEMWARITSAVELTCSTNTPNGNTAPVVNAGADYTIPYGTPFTLSGTASDANGTTLSYCWEQTDVGVSTDNPSTTSTTDPQFRSFSPQATGDRTFPQLSDILNNNLTPTWEVIPNVARTMDFALTVRDNGSPNGGQTNRDDMVVTTANTGPFTVTSQNTTGITWITGETRTITWNVAGTNAAPINTANVNILLSTDGGMTYETDLALNVPNDGSHDITVPAVSGGNCRVMVEGAGNIFFNINSESFKVNAVVTCTQFTSGNLGIAIPDGIGANEQGAAISNGIVVSGLTGNVLGSEIKVNVDITHTYIQDMVVQLTAPDGSTFNTLWARDCDGENDFDVVFSDDGADIVCAQPTVGNYKPFSPFTTFDGQSINGTWTIAMADFYNGDFGTLNDWYIEFCVTTSTLNIQDNFINNNLSIYPNPNKGSFTVALNSGIAEDISIDVYDIRGRQVYGKIYNGSDRFNQAIDLDVQSGIYLVKVSNGNFSETKKIIIE